VDERTLEWLDILGRALLWAAVAVIGLALISAIAIATSDAASGFLTEDVERQGRGVVAVAALAGGITASGVLAGLGALIRLKVVERRERGAGRS
jgi:hypothetical protein